MCSADIVEKAASAAQQLQQLPLYVLSVATLDQHLATSQEVVETGRVHTHTLLEQLHTHTHAIVP